MKVKELSFINYRNLTDGTITPSENVNVIYGENANGKTNLLEAVWLFCGGHSFRGSKENEMIRFDKDHFRLWMKFDSGEREQEAQIIFDKTRKLISINGVEKNSSSYLTEVFSAVVFSFHILVINHFTNQVPGVLLSCLQMIVAAVLSLIGVLVFKEAPTLAGITQAGGSLLYAGILSGGVAFTLQIIAQKHVEPVVASLIMCFEAVFGALGGWVILHERLSVREWTGCALMFAAILLVQWMTNDETRPVVSG